MKTFEEYLIENVEDGVIDFSVRAEVTGYDTKFYIHPANESGETMDFIVNDNELTLEE